MSEDKVKMKIRIKKNKFRSEMGLHVDKPRSGGSGTWNNENTARRLFEDPAVSSQITSIN